MGSKAAVRPLTGSLPPLIAVLVLASCQPAAVQPVPSSLAFPYNDAPTVEAYERCASALAGSYVSVHVFDVVKQARGAPRRIIVNGGSGTIVDPRGYVLTAAHIAKDPRFLVEVTSIDGRVHAGTIVAVSPGEDLALIRTVPFSGIQPARLSAGQSLAVGDALMGIGTPYGRVGVATVGNVLETRRQTRVAYAEYGYDDPIVLEMIIEPGYSGGPLFSATGELAGILASFGLGDTSRRPYVPTGITFAIPSSSIAAYLEKNLPP